VTARDLGSRAAHSPSSPDPWPWWAWVATFTSYVVLGYLTKSVVLNWIVGPLYPVLVMYVLPAGVRRLLGRPAPEAAP
jgi:hypothetical protein